MTRDFDGANRPDILGMPDGMADLVRGYDSGDRLNSLTISEQSLWGADYAGGRLKGIERANGLATTLTYDGEGRPIEVKTGVLGPASAISAPVHSLAFGWTESSLRRHKDREDTRRIVEQFHYDGVGHLESKPEQGLPAVTGLDVDLAAAVPESNPRQVEEWWTVNQVDELETRRRVSDGYQFDAQPAHDPDGLHQVVSSGNFSYDWDDNGNLGTRRLMQGQTTIATDTFIHDWRDRLVGVEQDSTTTTLIVDPLGRLVAKTRQGLGGPVSRIYLHDGDQVVAEYVQEAGGNNWQVDRRHHWGRWIDDLAVEQVDTDADGELDETLWPITDLLGSVQLLTDDEGRIVERIEYQTDGTPRIFAEDETAPRVTRVAWTGNGQRPSNDMVSPEIFEIAFDEWLDANLENVTATLTPDGGEAIELDVTLEDDQRGINLGGATIQAGVNYALHLEGLTDRSGNEMWELDLTTTVTDPQSYETLMDAEPPKVLALLDAPDGLLVLLDEPVVPVDGVNAADLMIVMRGENMVAGSSERLTGNLFKWTAGSGEPWYPQQRYEVTQINLEDLATTPNLVATPSIDFTHIATFDDQTLVAYSKPDHSQPLAQSRYGLTSLFQGRTWHEELGLYYYRARWYEPNLAAFLERDPVGYSDAQSLYPWVMFNASNMVDPQGREAYLVFREFNNWIRHAYPIDVGHFFIAFDESGLNDVFRWRWLVTRLGYQNTPRRSPSPNTETFSYHPWSVREARDPSTGELSADKTHNIIFAGILTLASYIGYNDDVDIKAFRSWRDGDNGKGEIPGNVRAWRLGVSQSQQEVLYQLAIQSRNMNNEGPFDDDNGWYRLFDNNCGSWARWMIERVGIEYPKEAESLNFSSGLGPTRDQRNEDSGDSQRTPEIHCTPSGCVVDGVPYGADGKPIVRGDR